KAGDRVGVALPKSTAALAALFGILKAGAAYVPVDYSAPVERSRKILRDCDIRALFADSRSVDVNPALDEPGVSLAALVVVGPATPARSPVATTFEDAVTGGSAVPRMPRSASDLAYILYTSGSTGTPKGVMLTHENAISFVEWSSSIFEPSEHDRFISHALFHFVQSVLDIYLSIKHGASLYLISEELAKNPRDLARFIASSALTVWYSTPSILTLLTQSGNLERYNCKLRLVLFAGEVFPAKHLRELQRRWPSPRYYNLYGPTETNVCTYAAIPDNIPEDRAVPYPIGVPCHHCEAIVLDYD